MRLSRLSLLLTACALTALAAPAVAQDAPVIIDPSVNPPAVAPVPGIDEIEPGERLPPLVVPANERPVEPPPAMIPIPAEWSPVPTDEMGRTAYGLYLSGRMAAFRGDNVLGADLLAQSQALTPEQPVVGEEAFRTGLFAGDLETLAELAPRFRTCPCWPRPDDLL